MIIVLTQKWNNHLRLAFTSLSFLKDNDRINKGQVWTLSDYCCDYCPKFQFLSAEVQLRADWRRVSYCRVIMWPLIKINVISQRSDDFLNIVMRI